MNTISIFLGSSHTLSRERVLIGNNIRKLSDLWEKKGVRLHLLVWEDYKAEYKGRSKQTDYDLDLVGKADLHPENDQHGQIMSIKQNIKDFASFDLYEK